MHTIPEQSFDGLLIIIELVGELTMKLPNTRVAAQLSGRNTKIFKGKIGLLLINLMSKMKKGLGKNLS